jgi:hypothetical protein
MKFLKSYNSTTNIFKTNFDSYVAAHCKEPTPHEQFMYAIDSLLHLAASQAEKLIYDFIASTSIIRSCSLARLDLSSSEIQHSMKTIDSVMNELRAVLSSCNMTIAVLHDLDCQRFIFC